MLLKHNIVGIDVDERELTVVQLNESRSVRAFGIQPIPKNVTSDAETVDEEALARCIKTALGATKPLPVSDPFAKPRASVGLPSTLVWSHSTRIPEEVPLKEIPAYIEKETAQWLPVDTSSLAAGHYVTTVAGTTYATYAGVSRNTYESFCRAFSNAAVTVDRLGSGFYAVARAVLPREFGEENYLIIDLHESHTSVGVFDEHAVAYMTIQSVAVPREKPEQSLPTLCDDVNRLRSHFEEVTGQPVTQIMVVGRHPDTTKLCSDLDDIFDVPVTLGDPLRHISNPELFADVAEPRIYAHAIGLALLAIEPSLPHVNFTANAAPDAIQKLAPALTLWSRLRALLVSSTHETRPPFQLYGTIMFTLLALVLLGLVLGAYVL